MTATSHRPLAGKRAWLITDGKAGIDVQARGLAEALGLDWDLRHVAPTGLQRLLSPYVPVARRERFGTEGARFAPPWPEVAIAASRLAIPYLRALKQRAGLATYAVVLQDPRIPVKCADLIWTPAHDRRRGPQVITTLTSPHPFSPDRLAALRASMPAAIAALPSPRVAVMLGGRNGVYTFDSASDARLAASLTSLATLGVGFMITRSRRTHDELLATVDAATRAAPRLLWTGGDGNPYPDFLAHADVLVVTADSVNMCGEAVATGKPVYVFTPGGGSAKFQRFHKGLSDYGATRPLPEHFDRLDTWSYAPLDATATLAAEIERRFLRRRSMVGPH